MIAKSVEKRLNFKISVKTGKGASEIILLTLGYGEYAIRTSSVFNGICGPTKDEVCRMTQGVGSQNSKDRCKSREVTDLSALTYQIRIRINESEEWSLLGCYAV
jgi:hypothetical protein